MSHGPHRSVPGPFVTIISLGYFCTDADRVWLLGADDTLTLIEDRHVAEMDQADFDELVRGTGPLRYRVGDAYDPQAAAERHRAWTAAIRAAMG